jgi:hypothetical protein
MGTRPLIYKLKRRSGSKTVENQISHSAFSIEVLGMLREEILNAGEADVASPFGFHSLHDLRSSPSMPRDKIGHSSHIVL